MENVNIEHIREFDTRHWTDVNGESGKLRVIVLLQCQQMLLQYLYRVPLANTPLLYNIIPHHPTNSTWRWEKTLLTMYSFTFIHCQLSILGRKYQCQTKPILLASHITLSSCMQPTILTTIVLSSALLISSQCLYVIFMHLC
jgi:hypothetical protein